MLNTFPRQIVNLTTKDILKMFSLAFSKDLHKANNVRKFERGFSRYIGAKYCITTSSARMGLYIILSKFGVKSGDEVILSTYTYHAIPNIICAMGLKPVFIDINEKDFNIDVSSIENAINSKTKAIIATHLYGQPCDIRGILKIAKKYDLKVIEDCAEACGAEYYGKKAGSLGDAAIFSFGVGKSLTSLDGGAITTNNEGLAKRIREESDSYPFPKRIEILINIILTSYIWFSSRPKIFGLTTYLMLRLFNNDFLDNLLKKTRKKQSLMERVPKKYKTKFTNLQAIICLDKLKILEQMNNKRIEYANIYNKNFKKASIETAELDPKNKNIYIAYAIRANNPENLRKSLLKKGIDTKKEHMYVCSNLEMFHKYKTECPNAEKITKKILHIPIYHQLKNKDVRYIYKNIGESLN